MTRSTTTSVALLRFICIDLALDFPLLDPPVHPPRVSLSKVIRGFITIPVRRPCHYQTSWRSGSYDLPIRSGAGKSTPNPSPPSPGLGDPVDRVCRDAIDFSPTTSVGVFSAISSSALRSALVVSNVVVVVVV